MFYINCFVNSKLQDVSLRSESFLNFGGILNIPNLGSMYPILDMQRVHLEVYWQHFIDIPELAVIRSLICFSTSQLCFPLAELSRHFFFIFYCSLLQCY